MSVEVIRAVAESREAAALVTVIGTKGSVPRHAGSKMLVRGTGAIVGTVGGGKGEALAVDAALRSIAAKRARIVTVEMQGVEAEGDTLLCGGVDTMLVEYVPNGASYAAACHALDAGRRTVFVKKLEGMKAGAAGTVSTAVQVESGPPPAGFALDQEAAALSMARGRPIYAAEKGLLYDPVFPREKLLILGGGHVGQALSAIAAGLDFEVTVADDRKEMTAPGRFLPAVKTVCAGYSEAIAAFPFDSATYVVILTRGHLFDLECLRGVLGKTFRYAGFIGSARKAGILRAQLLSDGFDNGIVDALHAPIGLEIAAETPSEIAISILAEIVAVRRNADPAEMPAAAKSGR